MIVLLLINVLEMVDPVATKIPLPAEACLMVFVRMKELEKSPPILITSEAVDAMMLESIRLPLIEPEIKLIPFCVAVPKTVVPFLATPI